MVSRGHKSGVRLGGGWSTENCTRWHAWVCGCKQAEGNVCPAGMISIGCYSYGTHSVAVDM